MLARVVAAVDCAGEPQVLVLGGNAEAVEEQLSPPGWTPVVAERWADGPGASLRAGLAAAPDAEAALIVLGDLPWLSPEAVERVLSAAAENPAAEAVRAVELGRPGHPVLLRGGLLAAAREAPDAGMAEVLASAEILEVRCDGLGVAADVDHAEDLRRGLDAPGES